MVDAYILFKVSSGSEREVAKKIADFDEVSMAGIIFGEYDLVAEVSVESLKALEGFIAEKIRTVPNILVTSTMIIASEYKGRHSRIRKG